MSAICQDNIARQGMYWRTVPRSVSARPGLILDRDGVLVDFVDYLHNPEETRLAAGSTQLVTKMKNAGVAVAVVTNQAGIARALYDWKDYISVEEEIDRQLAAMGTSLDGVVACPYHPDFTTEWSEGHSYWRKPGPGMIELLIRELNISRDRCWMIGDHVSDIGAARAAGLPGAILVRQGWGIASQAASMALASPSFEVLVIDDLTQAMLPLSERFGLTEDSVGEGRDRSTELRTFPAGLLHDPNL